jgi:hypothetical protein
MRSAPLAFDFAAKPRTTGWTGWLLLAAGAAFAAGLGRSYLAVEGDIARLEARFSAFENLDEPARAERAVNPEELAAARSVVGRFATPWPALFAAIEAVRVDDVVLLSIEPDVGAGRVVVTGEARSYLAALTYVAQLAAQPGLSRVHLSRHEARDKGSRRVWFSVMAQWKAPA